MGAHTLGQFSTFAEHIDYAWVRGQGDDSRNELWNNEYYKTLVGSPSHVKDKYCTGEMDGSAPKHTWTVRANLFESYWPQGEPWIDRPRRLLWNHLVTRSPTCEEAEEDGLGNGGKFWDKVDCQKKSKCINSDTDFKLAPENNFWEYCCKQKQDECWKTNSCDEECTRTVQNRIRHLSSDVGFYLKFEFDAQGYPKMTNLMAWKGFPVSGLISMLPDPTAMIAHCGGFIMAVNSFIPNIPRFDIVKVPP